MSFLPEISSEEYEELFKLFAAGHYVIGPTTKEILNSQRQLQHRLRSIWDAVDPNRLEWVLKIFGTMSSGCF